MYITEFFLLYHIRQVKCGGKRRRCYLLLPEGHAVSTLLHSGIALVGAYQDLVQRTVVGFITVISTLPDSTLNALVCVTIHDFFLLLLRMVLVWLNIQKPYAFSCFALTFTLGTFIIFAENLRFEGSIIESGSAAFRKERKICHDL